MQRANTIVPCLPLPQYGLLHYIEVQRSLHPYYSGFPLNYSRLSFLSPLPIKKCRLFIPGQDQRSNSLAPFPLVGPVYSFPLPAPIRIETQFLGGGGEYLYRVSSEPHGLPSLSLDRPGILSRGAGTYLLHPSPPILYHWALRAT